MKVVLAIDMPAQCASCPMWDLYPFKGEVFDICKATGKKVFPCTKSNDCPLKPLPEELDYNDIPMIAIKNNINIVNSIDFMNGWNACLKEIIGETE